MSESIIEAVAAGIEAERPAGEVVELLKTRWAQILQGEFQEGVPLNATSPVPSNQLLVKAGAGMLFGLTASSTLGGGQFIQAFDTATLPANGAVPVVTFPIATVSTLTVSYIFPGRFFYTGIFLANSTTQNSLTLGATNTLFDAQYI